MKPSTRSYYQQVVARAVAAIATHLDEAVDLASLARDAALAPLHFHQIFAGMIGETPLALHRRLRMERAASRLLDGEDAITTIAFAAGYETHESFTRAFRAAFGAAPSVFRSEARAARGECRPPRSTRLGAVCGVHYGDGLEDARADAGPVITFTGGTTMHVELKTLEAMRTAAVHHVGPYHQIGEAFGRLGALVGAQNGAPGGQMVAVYHDDPEAVPPDALRSDAALTIADGAKLPAGTTELTIPGGRYACYRHVGPYSELPDVWQRLLGQWLPQSGHRIVAGGVSFEIYRNTPMDTAPALLITEIYVPVGDGQSA